MTAAIVLGKLPFHGDFVARGISANERDDLDAWLANSMAAAREQLRDRFADAFDCAPAWHFGWHDLRWTAGALVPSMDSAGRRFPLLVARTSLTSDQVIPTAKLCEDVAASAISNRWSVDRVFEAVEAAEVARSAPRAAEGWWNEELYELGTLSERRPAAILSHMLSAAVGP